ncbi:PPOX class F420-dependent oxidoreductase [Geodermatophilus bullaregiensis]|uniref:PPOX class F420-dependent oxidoreductase n=1 Tax=Geodermatophilus bullaregiensis TaxID=1564160 RepID=UPI00195D1E03
MDQLLSLAEERFILLTTYRRSGEAVSTPVWVGRQGDALVVLTSARSGKVKRIRRDPRVLVQPCGPFGKVPKGVEPMAGIAEVREDPTDVERVTAIIRRTYPIESRVFMLLEPLHEWLRRQAPVAHYALHITSDPRVAA